MNDKYTPESLPSRLVVKFGTKYLLGEFKERDQHLDDRVFADAARQIVELQRGGTQIVIVSSGSVITGWRVITDAGTDSPFLDQEEFAEAGIPHLLNQWSDAFGLYRRCDEKEPRLVIPGVGENDRLAKGIAVDMEADAILFLADVAGVFEDDPSINPQARLYEEAASIEAILEPHTWPSGLLGTGGMKVKLEEALQCSKAGMRVAIAGNEEDVILKFARGESVGTTIGTITRFK